MAMSKYPNTLESPRPPRMVMVNPRHHTRHGLCMPNGEVMSKPMRLPEGTYLWTGDNRLARVGTFGVKVLTHSQTAREITNRMASKLAQRQVLQQQEVERGATERLFRKLRRNTRRALWLNSEALWMALMVAGGVVAGLLAVLS